AAKFRATITEYAVARRPSFVTKDSSFVVTPEMTNEVYQRLQSRGIPLSRAVYDSAAPLVRRIIGQQVARVAFGPRVEFARGLRDDAALAKAVELLNGVHTSKDLLARAPAPAR